MLFPEGVRGGWMRGEVGLEISLLSEKDWSEDAGLGNDEAKGDNGEGGFGA